MISIKDLKEFIENARDEDFLVLETYDEETQGWCKIGAFQWYVKVS